MAAIAEHACTVIEVFAAWFALASLAGCFIGRAIARMAGEHFDRIEGDPQ